MVHRSQPRHQDELIDLHAPLEPTEQIRLAWQKLGLCLKLAHACFQYLGFGWKWLACLMRLVLFSALLSPGLLITALFYYFSSRVHRNVWYSREARNLLDIYIPYRHHFEHGRVPVLIYVTGGAYIIGYKAWGAVFARRMSQCGVIVCCLDYRNFPQAAVDEMVYDVQRGIGWVLNRIEGFGGDSSQVYLMGQSCGGHLAALALIWQHYHRATIAPLSIPITNEALPWRPEQIQGYIGFCSPYNIEVMQLHFQKRGLAPRVLNGIFQPSLSSSDNTCYHRVCPVSQLKAASQRYHLPRSMLLHAQDDVSVPCDERLEMAKCLRDHGTEVRHKVYQAATHTSKLIEEPFRGGKDDLVTDVLDFMDVEVPGNLQFQPLVPFPYIITTLARWVCPF
eukprot:jgi/Ulvmu1/8278/UM041_0089.1